MDSGSVVLDISSDEEGWGETRAGGGGDDDDYDWLSELLEKVDREVDDADVVLVGDAAINHKSMLKSSSVAEKPSVKDLDDDCVVLDGDPDKPVAIGNNIVDDSDDLLIVAEKGQIACRDYPHPRHLCAKFPFTSTPHERHCPQCHCFVCDSLAPCVHWCTDTSSINHCHATDKAEFWKLQRQNFKQGDKAPLSLPKLPAASHSMGALQTIQVPPHALLQPLPVPESQVSRPTTIRACSTSANFGTPNIANRGRSQQSVYVLPRNKMHQRLVSQQLPGTRIRRDRRHNTGNLGPQFINSHANFKRVGSAGVALTTDRSGHRSSNHNNVSQYLRNPSLQYNGSSFGNSVPYHPQVSSHPNMGSIFPNSVPYQPRVSSQPSIGSSFVNSVPSPQASFWSNTGSNSENSVHSQPHAYAQPNMGNSFVHSVPSQLEVYSQPIPSSNDGQDGFQHRNEAPKALDPSFPDFNTSWVTPTGQSSIPPLADNSQNQSAGPTYHSPHVADFGPQFPVSAPHLGSLDFSFNSWMLMLENQSVSGAVEASMSNFLGL